MTPIETPLNVPDTPPMPTLTETMLDLIEASGMTLKDVADKAGVPYQPLRRFVKGQRGKPGGRVVRSYDVQSADAIHAALAGKQYVEDAP